MNRTLTDKAPLSVGFLLLPRFTMLAFAAFVDALRLAADDGDRSRPINCSWAVLAPGGRPVRASCGVEVRPTEPMGDPRRFDYLVVVGGLLRGQQDEAPELGAYLRAAAAAGVTLAGVCTGSFVLARAGLMRGRRCCVSWFHHREFAAEFPELTIEAERAYVVDGDRITCAGGASVLDLASHIIARHIGRPVAEKCRRIMIVEAAIGAAGQPLVASPVVADRRVRAAMLLIEQSDGRRPVAELAAQLGISSRQLERGFKAALGIGPAAYARRVTLERARALLRGTDRPVSAIAQECGFADHAHFGRCFRQAYGMAPRAWRRREGGVEGVAAAPRST